MALRVASEPAARRPTLATRRYSRAPRPGPKPFLYDDIERWAADELRSVNAQIEYLLREQVRKRKGTGGNGSKSEDEGR